MQYEVENKYRVTSAAELQQRLATDGIVLAAAVVQCDTYFAHPARDFRQTDEALRIRRVGDTNFVTYKGPKLDVATKTRRELELSLESGDLGAARFAELLEALGFRFVAEVRKRRREATLTWQQRAVQIAWDEIDHEGTFLELETLASDDDLGAAKASLLALAEAWQLGPVEPRGYLRMLLERRGSAQ